MSDGAAPLVTESAPVSEAPMSSSDVAAQVVESYEQTSETPVDTTNTVETTEAPAEPVKTEAKKSTEASRAVEFLKRLGHDLKRSDGRRAFMPLDAVAKTLDHYLDEHGSTWNTERTTLESKAKELQQHIDSLRAAVAGDPEAFLRELSGVDTRYQRFLQQQAQEKREAVADAANDPMPQPDFDLGNGTKTYTLDGLQKLREWDKRQTLRELEGKIDEKLKPITEREKQSQEQARIERTVTQQLETAASWPNWTDYKDDVLKMLQKDTAEAQQRGERPKMSLREAYLEVRSERLATDHNTVRERVLKELNGAGKSPALARTGAESTAKPAGPRSSADIVREVLAKSGA